LHHLFTGVRSPVVSRRQCAPSMSGCVACRITPTVVRRAQPCGYRS
jgi:hypothetical protein